MSWDIISTDWLSGKSFDLQTDQNLRKEWHGFFCLICELDLLSDVSTPFVFLPVNLYISLPD